MNTKEALKILVGSFTVYGAVVACSAASGGGQPVMSALADINAGGSRLKANYYAGSDGSQQFLDTFHDTQRNEDCAFGKASDGTTRCLPSEGPSTAPSTYSVFYADPACTQPILALTTCSGNTAPSYVQVGGAPMGGNKGGPAYYTVGSKTSVSMAYELTYTGGPGALGPSACGAPPGIAPTCTPLPAMAADAGVGDDAGTPPPLVPPVGPPAWSDVESTSTIYSLVEVPPSAFVEATQKTMM